MRCSILRRIISVATAVADVATTTESTTIDVSIVQHVRNEMLRVNPVRKKGIELRDYI